MDALKIWRASVCGCNSVTSGQSILLDIVSHQDRVIRISRKPFGVIRATNIFLSRHPEALSL